MEADLWYVLAGTRGAETRAAILEAIADQPQNAHQLAKRLGYDYTTIRHHLAVLDEHDVVDSAGSGYGNVYLPSSAVREEWAVVEEIIATIRED